MRTWHTLLTCCSVAALAAACGFTDGGGGTRTLRVVAELSYSAHDNETGLRILVEKDGLPVDNAIVQVEDVDSGVALVAGVLLTGVGLGDE